MIRELDSVVLTHDLDQNGLKEGDVGAVVHDYGDGQTFEVEFVSVEGVTLALLTLTVDDIRPLQGRKILHVRELV